mmetsp:Transcript_6001/g.14584  ORF Transcript_6001/g.14584 Transcript_6001/m.14584 type:complete len:80 (-) Transcript_6001:148-387(-)
MKTGPFGAGLCPVLVANRAEMVCELLSFEGRWYTGALQPGPESLVAKTMERFGVSQYKAWEWSAPLGGTCAVRIFFSVR